MSMSMSMFIGLSNSSAVRTFLIASYPSGVPAQGASQTRRGPPSRTKTYGATERQKLSSPLGYEYSRRPPQGQDDGVGRGDIHTDAIEKVSITFPTCYRLFASGWSFVDASSSHPGSKPRTAISLLLYGAKKRCSARSDGASILYRRSFVAGSTCFSPAELHSPMAIFLPPASSSEPPNEPALFLTTPCWGGTSGRLGVNAEVRA